MKDIELAKKLLEKERFALAIVKEGKLIFSSRDRGIKPMYTALKELKDDLEGSSIADKVIGKAAALLCNHAHIKALYTKLISENAIKVLQKTSIQFDYAESTPYIKNRDKTGMCPVEALSQKYDNAEELLEAISNFLQGIKEKS